jgi:antitoxin (DNA-binding transcriptional repressor) of toxin-antitoxin stability system
MTTIELTNEAPDLEKLLILAQQQAGLVLTREGQPVAQVLPVAPKPTRRVAPLHPGDWEVQADFDAPVTEEFLLGQP